MVLDQLVITLTKSFSSIKHLVLIWRGTIRFLSLNKYNKTMKDPIVLRSYLITAALIVLKSLYLSKQCNRV